MQKFSLLACREGVRDEIPQKYIDGLLCESLEYCSSQLFTVVLYSTLTLRKCHVQISPVFCQCQRLSVAGQLDLL